MQARWLELRSRLAPSWRAILSRTEIENCENRFLFRCPERWDNLAATRAVTVRFCQACRERVYYCSTIEEARERAQQGACVAVDEGLARSPGDVTSEVGSEDGIWLGLMDSDAT